MDTSVLREVNNTMKLLKKRAQSTGEYAILFAIVLGGVIAMQNYARNRIAGGIQKSADNYLTAITGAAKATITQDSTSDSTQTATMTSAKAGTLKQTGKSSQTVTNPE